MKPYARRVAAAACACWLAALLAAGPARSGAQSPAFAASPGAARAGEVVLAVTVTDKSGRYVTGIGRESFAVAEGKAAREVTWVREAGREPLSVALVFDVSGSMGSDLKLLPAIKAAAARFVARSNEANEYLVAEFGGKGGVRVLSDWTRDRDALAAAVQRVATANSKKGKPEARGLTYWQDACAEVVGQFGGAANARRVMLLLGDGGEDSGSRVGDDGLRRRLRGAGVLFYAVTLSLMHFTPSPDGQQDLDEITEASGGRVLFTHRLADVGVAADRVAAELRNQYLVGFVASHAAAEGSWAKVEVKVGKLEGVKGTLRARSPGGYFSRGPAAAGRR